MTDSQTHGVKSAESVERDKAELLALNTLFAPQGKYLSIARKHLLPPSTRGQRLLEPFLPVIKAAHRNELPNIIVPLQCAEDLNTYVCRISTNIWYGFVLGAPSLFGLLENLRRIQEWYETTQIEDAE